MVAPTYRAHIAAFCKFGFFVLGAFFLGGIAAWLKVFFCSLNPACAFRFVDGRMFLEGEWNSDESSMAGSVSANLPISLQPVELGTRMYYM